MRLAPVVCGATVVAITGCCWNRGHAWQADLLGILAPSTDRERRRLVREEDVYGPPTLEKDEEQEALLLTAQLPRKGPMRALVQAVSEQLSAWLLLEELQQWRLQRDEARGTESGGSISPSEAAAQEELRAMIQELLLVVALSLKVLGGLLLLIVPTTLLAFGLLGLVGPVLWQVQASSFTSCLETMEWLLVPLLIRVARVLGIPRSEVLGENSHEPQAATCAKRVLLGALVLNILCSLFAVLALASIALLVRLTGVLTD